MKLNKGLKGFTHDRLTAIEARNQAAFIAWGPVVFQASRLMVKFGIFEAIGQSADGMTRGEIVAATRLSDYAVKCLLEASLCIGTVLVDEESGRYTLSKTGWFLLNDPAVHVDMNFNHDVNYEAFFRLEESLLNGKPEGLSHFGPWPTIYEGLSSLPPHVRQSWLEFDHFYSDSAFPQALHILFDEHRVRTLYDVGGNTGKWALACVGYDSDVRVTVLDLPQQIAMMRDNIAGKPGAERISASPIDLLAPTSAFPRQEGGVDAIWMSQFLDCFSMEQATDILLRASQVMTPATRLYIMETLWDRQRFEPAALSLTMTSLYFTVMANGNSKMFNTDDLEQCIHDAGLDIEHIYDSLGMGHSLMVVKKS